MESEDPELLQEGQVARRGEGLHRGGGDGDGGAAAAGARHHRRGGGERGWKEWVLQWRGRRR